MKPEEIRENALKHAVNNAASYEGKAQIGPVVGKILGEFPELRPRSQEVVAIVKQVVSEVNSWTIERQRSTLEERWPELLETRRKEEKKALPPLENVDRFEMVKTRFAPNPDGALHLGSAEPIIFCDEYAKMYDGHFILRYEDTSAEVKPPIPEMYDWIREDLEWLGVKIDETYVQSDRLPIYYEHAEMLLSQGAAYVCTCPPGEFRDLYMASKPCPCRDLPPEENLARWRMMLEGPYDKGDAVVRVKTEIDHPNPAVRDWPALRISTAEHPRQGTSYRVWPLYNFSCAVDDHLLGVSHIIRGKEHEVNTTRQRYVFKHLGWEYPEIINVGRLGLEVGILSKSRMRAGIEDGIYSGWDDPRMGTLRALKRRGLQPETVRELMIQVGPKPINSTLSWDHIASMNRRIIEPTADRYYFVRDPVPMEVSGLEEALTAELPLHPDNPERGRRRLTVEPKKVLASLIISRDDADVLGKGDLVRLMGLINVEIGDVTPQRIRARLHSMDYREARDREAPFIHWLPEGVGIEAEVVMPDATTASGLAEPGCEGLSVDEMIQFERFGFVRVDSTDPLVAYYAHR